ncbi:MAG: glycosyltransferase family 9 protein [Bacteroidota bacterium]|jgi:ADP-heptose:LPS heptosyltransferase
MAPENIRRILLTRMKYIGDVVLTTPIIRATRQTFPRAYIAYMGDKKAVSLLEHNPFLDEIIPYDFSSPSIFEQPRVALELRRRKFDVVVDLFSNPRSALLTWASGAPVRIGKEVRGRGKLYTQTIGDVGSLTSAIEFHYAYVKPLGVQPTCWKTEVFLTEDEKRGARTYLQLNGVNTTRPIVAVHPGATWPNKLWLKENFVGLIDRLRAKLGVEIVMTPGPEDIELVKAISSSCIAPVIALPVLPVRQLAAVFSVCNVLVSNDCGPMHIGVAVGTKTIGIFGPEPPEVWFRYSPEDGHLALFKKIECSPCRQTSCHRAGAGYLECMKLISVDEVFEEVKKRL